MLMNDHNSSLWTYNTFTYVTTHHSVFLWKPTKIYSILKKFLLTSGFNVLESRRVKIIIKNKKYNKISIHSASHCECREGSNMLLKFEISIGRIRMKKGKRLEKRGIASDHVGSQT